MMFNFVTWSRIFFNSLILFLGGFAKILHTAFFIPTLLEMEISRDFIFNMEKGNVIKIKCRSRVAIRVFPDERFFLCQAFEISIEVYFSCTPVRICILRSVYYSLYK